MGRDSFRKNVWKGRRLRILAVNPAEQKVRLHEAIARRAYRLFESRGVSPGREGEDWKRAESEIVHPLECGLVTHDDKVSICTDMAVFAEGNVDVCVEPRRLILCGRLSALENRGSNSELGTGYLLLDLPVEVEPSHVHARFNGRILEIDLYRTPLLARAA